MKYLLLSLLLWGYNAGAQSLGKFRGSDSSIIFHHALKIELIKCKHIYVSTIPVEVKIEQAAYNPMGGMGMLDLWPVRQSGKKEGQEIVCVKCHHVTRQILDYGPPDTSALKLWPKNTLLDSTNTGYKLFWHPAKGKLVPEFEITIGSGSCGPAKSIFDTSGLRTLSEIIVESCESVLLRRK